MSSALSDVAIKLAVEYLLPYVVQEATTFASRSAIKDAIPPIPSTLTAPKQQVTGPRARPTALPAILSNTPGRVRLHVAGLRGNSAHRRAIVASLTRLAGVQTVNANDLTGNVLVLYDTQLIQRVDILKAVCLEDPVGQLNPPGRSKSESPTYPALVSN